MLCRMLSLGAVLGLVAMSSGCVVTRQGDVWGEFFTSTKSTSQVVDNNVQALKSGEAVATGIVGVATGDSSVGAAMANGGIKKVHRVDSEVFNVLSIYAVHKTIVWGE